MTWLCLLSVLGLITLKLMRMKQYLLLYNNVTILKQSKFINTVLDSYHVSPLQNSTLY